MTNSKKIAGVPPMSDDELEEFWDQFEDRNGPVNSRYDEISLVFGCGVPMSWGYCEFCNAGWMHQMLMAFFGSGDDPSIFVSLKLARAIAKSPR